MKNIPGCIRERWYSVTRVLPNDEAFAAAMARASQQAKRMVQLGYRVVGHGKSWKVELDPEKSFLLVR
jgi:hypothetical protein